MKNDFRSSEPTLGTLTLIHMQKPPPDPIVYRQGLFQSSVVVAPLKMVTIFRDIFGDIFPNSSMTYRARL